MCVTGIHYNTLKYNLDVKFLNHLDVYAVTTLHIEHRWTMSVYTVKSKFYRLRS